MAATLSKPSSITRIFLNGHLEVPKIVPPTFIINEKSSVYANSINRIDAIFSVNGRIFLDGDIIKYQEYVITNGTDFIKNPIVNIRFT